MRVEREFAVVEQGEPRRREGGDLARQFGADRAAGAGHQHAPPGDQRAHGGAVEHRLRPAEQVLDRDRLDRCAASSRVSWKSVRRGSRASGMPSSSAEVEEAAHRRAVERLRAQMMRRCGRSPRRVELRRRPSRISSIVPSTGTPPMSRPTRVRAVGDDADHAIEPAPGRARSRG